MAKTKPGEQHSDTSAGMSSFTSDPALRSLIDGLPELYRTAALVGYGVELSDLHIRLIMSRQMSFRDAVREAKCEYQEAERVRH